MIIMQANRPS